MDVTNDNVNRESVVSGNLESVASSGNREQRYAKLRQYNNLREIQRQNESSDKNHAQLERERLVKAKDVNNQRKVQRDNESLEEK